MQFPLPEPSYLQRNVLKPLWDKLFTFSRIKEHGICQRVHGNNKRLPQNTLPQAVTEDVWSFLTNYFEENAVVLHGRISGFKNDIRLLSSSDTNERVAGFSKSMR